MGALFWSCEKEDTVTPPPPPAAQSIFILNALGKTISMINLQTEVCVKDIKTVGIYPNQIVYRNGKLYVVNSGSNNVQIFNADTYDTLGVVNVGSGTNPMLLAFVSDTKGYVTCLMTDEVKVIDFSTKKVTKSIKVGVGPTGIAVASNKVYVTNTALVWPNYGQGNVSVINTTVDTVIKTINVSTNPQAAAVDPDGKVHVVCTGDYGSTPGKISIIDPTTDAVVKTIDIGGTPSAIGISSAKVAYLGSFSKGIASYNTATYTVNAVMDTAIAASAIVVDNSGYLYFSDFSKDKVSKVKTDGTVLKEFTVGDGPISMSLK
jgi:YVTN family beta-propeller protein